MFFALFVFCGSDADTEQESVANDEQYGAKSSRHSVLVN